MIWGMLAAFAVPALLIVLSRSFSSTVAIVLLGWALFAWAGWETASPDYPVGASLADMAYLGVAYAAACWAVYFLATRIPRWLKSSSATPPASE